MSRSEAAILSVSPALWAAQQQLLALRQQRQNSSSADANEDGRFQEKETSQTKHTAAHTNQQTINPLPSHLGWESVRVTETCRSKSSHNEESADSSWWQNLAAERMETAVSPTPTFNESLKLQPTLALAMLRQGEVAAGRIWLLLRHLDAAGCGWLDVEQVRAQLSDKQSPLRICGWRQLRKLLAQGEDIFWQRDKERLWLRSISKVGAALQSGRLQGHPIALPIKVLIQSIGTVRAHFYASFHSGRDSQRPIARQTLQRLSGVSPHTQRDYERKAHVQSERNFVVGPSAQAPAAEEIAWRRGGACFQLTDRQGQQGKPGTTYLAWQLPNSYRGPHAAEGRGGQKRFNQELVDLWTKGTTGNGRFEGTKRYFDNAQAAVKSFHKGTTEVHWPGKGRCWRWLADKDEIL